MVKPSSVSNCFQCFRAFRQLICLLAAQVLCLSQFSLLLRELWSVSVAASAVSASEHCLAHKQSCQQAVSSRVLQFARGHCAS